MSTYSDGITGESANILGGVGSFKMGGGGFGCKTVGGNVGSAGGELGMTAGLSAGVLTWGGTKHVDDLISGDSGSISDT